MSSHPTSTSTPEASKSDLALTKLAEVIDALVHALEASYSSYNQLAELMQHVIDQSSYRDKATMEAIDRSIYSVSRNSTDLINHTHNMVLPIFQALSYQPTLCSLKDQHQA
jgi:hypothetical protein